MKRVFIILAGAALVLASCAKTEVANTSDRETISFQPVSKVSTKVTGPVFPTSESFGTYAWTEGTSGEYFIDNQIVSYDATTDVWTTATPFYWPKNQTVDFFSYYPHNATGTVPTVTKTKITYSNVDFSASQLDFMYADKAVAYTDNVDEVTDGQNAYKGVPTIFRHAACKVKINVALGENEKTEGDGTVTKWEVTLKNVQLSGIYVKGSLTLNLSDASATGVVAWTKPQDTNGFYLWDADNTVTNAADNALYKDTASHVLKKNVGQTVINDVYMLPQLLKAGQQKITLTYDVVTYRKAPGASDFSKALTQTDVVANADLLIDTGTASSSIMAWQMNQNIVYNITIGPAGKQITFDPAVGDWDNISSSIEIAI